MHVRRMACIQSQSLRICDSFMTTVEMRKYFIFSEYLASLHYLYYRLITTGFKLYNIIEIRIDHIEVNHPQVSNFFTSLRCYDLMITLYCPHLIYSLTLQYFLVDSKYCQIYQSNGIDNYPPFYYLYI